MTVSNTKFSQLYSTHVQVYSSIYALELIQINISALVNTWQVFQARYVSLGEPSCAYIELTQNNAQYNAVTIGTSSSTCASLYPSVNTYLGPYNVTSGQKIWSFQMKMTKIGLTTVNVRISNMFTAPFSLSDSLNVVAKLTQCENPSLAIENGAPLFYKPVEFKRNELISFVGIVTINCNTSLENTKKWTIFEIDPVTDQSLKEITLPLNPTVDYAELVIQPNTLKYGLYKIVFRVIMGSVKPLVFEDQIETFAKIVPSGVIVSALKLSQLSVSGTLEINKGTSQDIEFDPFLSSYDIDGLADMLHLQYKYYCQVVDSGVARGFPLLSVDNKIDLAMLKSDASLTLANNANKMCFESSGCNSYFILFNNCWGKYIMLAQLVFPT